MKHGRRSGLTLRCGGRGTAFGGNDRVWGSRKRTDKGDGKGAWVGMRHGREADFSAAAAEAPPSVEMTGFGRKKRTDSSKTKADAKRGLGGDG